MDKHYLVHQAQQADANFMLYRMASMDSQAESAAVANPSASPNSTKEALLPPHQTENKVEELSNDNQASTELYRYRN